MQLAREPKVIQLAKDLGLNWRGDCLSTIRDFALAEVERVVDDSPIRVDSLDSLRRVLANKFRMKMEVIREDADIERIAAEYPEFHPGLRARLNREFLQLDTEGITLERDQWDERLFQYLAVVDARGARAARVYFTSWHEVTHLILHPAQLRFPGFRRTPARAERDKDPFESVIDHVAGKIAFHPRFFRPAIEQALVAHGLTFEALDAARESAAPTASLFATAMGSLAYFNVPTLLVTAELSLKAAERRLVSSPQATFDFAAPQIDEKLRVCTCVPNDLVLRSGLAIRRNMRVPAQSVLAQVHESAFDVTLEAQEDQEWWETSRDGPLDPLPIRVLAARKGRFVYGLVSVASKVAGVTS